VFQRCAEETLRVLRGGSEVILTVLEVFKYDPLHSWYLFLNRAVSCLRLLTYYLGPQAK
jgi:phosphatidylinositol kinase/protein kinase (PI-3  family)